MNRRNVVMALAGLLALLWSAAGMARAGTVTVDRWSHGAWHVRFFANPDFPGFGGCEVWTGSDGAGVFGITVGEDGVDASLSYVPVAPRGYPSPLIDGDFVSLIVDGQVIPVSQELEIYELENEFGEWEVSADAGNSGVAGTVRSLRAGGVMEVGVTRQGQMTIYETYALTGFTATWLKAAEWCGFDPDKRFATL